MHSDTSIRKRIAHAILVTIVHPTDDKHFFVRKLGKRAPEVWVTVYVAHGAGVKRGNEGLGSDLETVDLRRWERRSGHGSWYVDVT